MFRSRFNDAFAKSLPHYGPQDIEAGVAETLPGEQAEKLLCALLGLVLNRKKDIEYGSHLSLVARLWAEGPPESGELLRLQKADLI